MRKLGRTTAQRRAMLRGMVTYLLENGKIEINNDIVDFTNLVNELKEMFIHEMSKKDIEFVTSINVKTPAIYTDALRISQVITNLLSNALKFTNPGGKVTFQVTELKSPDDTAHFQIRIEDTGVGMSEEFQKHLFNAFEREHNTTKSGIQGTGLGLAITKNLVQLLGGTLTYNSMLGIGTEFTITFKAKKAEEEKKDRIQDLAWQNCEDYGKSHYYSFKWHTITGLVADEAYQDGWLMKVNVDVSNAYGAKISGVMECITDSNGAIKSFNIY